MNAHTDQQLLRDYADSHSEAAFTELVRRHIDLVYSAALRLVCSAHQAQDVTQGVFLALAQNARQLTHHPVLSGWLHRTTQNLAANAVRTNVRRQTREKEAAAMNELLSAEPDPNWEHIAPHLDAALGELSEPDRDALLLRYFERKSAHEMAQTLGISDEAAQKRVSRAVERLRELFSKRGVAVGASGLAVVIAANAVQAAPVGLAVTISSAAALAGTTTAAATTAAAINTIAMSAFQKTIITATVAVLAGVGIYEARQASQLREQNQALQEQQAPLTEQIQRFQSTLANASNRLAGLLAENGRLISNPYELELLKLRGEVAQLKAARNPQSENNPPEGAARTLAEHANQLKQFAEQNPDKCIPELQLLTDTDWFNSVSGRKLETDADYREAMNSLRCAAKGKFGDLLRQALKNYSAANDGLLPGDLSQLEGYFESPMDGAMLLRYKLLQTGKLSEVPPDETLVAEKAPLVDDAVDTLYEFRMNGTKSTGVRKPQLP